MECAPAIVLEPLSAARLDVFESLLGAPCFGGCFCAVWTSYDDTWAARCEVGQPNRDITRGDVLGGRAAGYLVFVDGALGGWLGGGPRDQFPLLQTKLGSRRGRHVATTWAVGCLSLLPALRGRGVGALSVSALVAEARAAGADRVEAFPTRPWDEPRSYRGSYRMYERLGFSIVDSERDGASEVLLMALALDGVTP